MGFNRLSDRSAIIKESLRTRPVAGLLAWCGVFFSYSGHRWCLMQLGFEEEAPSFVVILFLGLGEGGCECVVALGPSCILCPNRVTHMLTQAAIKGQNSHSQLSVVSMLTSLAFDSSFFVVCEKNLTSSLAYGESFTRYLYNQPSGQPHLSLLLLPETPLSLPSTTAPSPRPFFSAGRQSLCLKKT